MPTPTWISGARSIAPLNADGYYSFSVPAGVVGVVAGLNYTDTSADPAEIDYGLYFSGGTMYVSEGGETRTSAHANTGQLCHIARSGSTVYYCVGTTPTNAPGSRFMLPGTVIYTSTVPSAGTVYLDASLLAAGDAIDDAALTDVLTGGTASASFEPMQTYASDAIGSRVSIQFKPMGLTVGFASSVGVAFPTLRVYASADDNIGRVNVGFVPMTAKGYSGTSWDGVVINAAMQPMGAFASAAGTVNSASISVGMQPMKLFAASGVWARAVANLPAMWTSAKGGPSISAFPAFYVVMPAFGNSADAPDLTEVGLGDEIITGDWLHLVDDVGYGDGSAAIDSAADEIVESVAAGSDQLYLGVGLALTDIGLADDFTMPAGGSYLLTDAAVVNDLTLPSGVSSLLVIETATGADAALPWFETLLTDDIAVSEALILSVSLALTDIGSGDDALIAETASKADLVTEGATASDEMVVAVVTQALLTDVVRVDEVLFMRDPGMIAWVMNTESGGVSWYDNWAFSDMVMVDGKLLGIGPEGLAVVAGEADAGDNINANVQFGFTDFSGYTREGQHKNDDLQKKRVDQFWVGYHSDGVLNATVETYGQGYSPFTYTMVQRDADQQRNGRISPGKGLNARFWRIGFANTNGCAFQVNSIAADVIRSKRKI